MLYHVKQILVIILQLIYYDRSITQSVLHLIKKKSINCRFLMLDSFSLYRLHAVYCMNLYGIVDYNSRYIMGIFISGRKGIGKLFRLPYRIHNYLVSGMVE